MKNKSPIIKVNILVCFLVILLLTACSPGKPVQNVREDESTAVDVPADPPQKVRASHLLMKSFGWKTWFTGEQNFCWKWMGLADR